MKKYRHTKRVSWKGIAIILISCGIIVGMYFGIAKWERHKAPYQLGDLITGLNKANVEFLIYQYSNNTDPALDPKNHLFIEFYTDTPVTFRGHKLIGISVRIDSFLQNFLIETRGPLPKTGKLTTFDTGVTIRDFLMDLNNPLWQSWTKSNMPAMPEAVE